MKPALTGLFIAFVALGGFVPAQAGNLKDQVKVEIESAGLHPGMDPGMYVCGGGHLHIKGTVLNMAGVPLGRITVAGKAYDGDGKLLGTATATTKAAQLAPGHKAEINVEFLTVTGLYIPLVKRHEITVIEAPAKE